MNIILKHVSSKDVWAKPKEGSSCWLEYWNKYCKEYYPKYCPDCRKRIYSDNELVGAHVKKCYSIDNNVYIVPVCKSCNTAGGTDNHEFMCDSNLLVPSNKERL